MFLFKKIISPFLMPLPIWLIISFAGLYLLWCTKKQKAGKILVSTGMLFIILMSLKG